MSQKNPKLTRGPQSAQKLSFPTPRPKRRGASPGQASVAESEGLGFRAIGFIFFLKGLGGRVKRRAFRAGGVRDVG